MEMMMVVPEDIPGPWVVSGGVAVKGWAVIGSYEDGTPAIIADGLSEADARLIASLKYDPGD
jgi:hypothetical protein